MTTMYVVTTDYKEATVVGAFLEWDKVIGVCADYLESQIEDVGKTLAEYYGDWGDGYAPEILNIKTKEDLVAVLMNDDLREDLLWETLLIEETPKNKLYDFSERIWDSSDWLKNLYAMCQAILEGNEYISPIYDTEK